MKRKCFYAHYKNDRFKTEQYDWDHETPSKKCTSAVCEEMGKNPGNEWVSVVNAASKSPKELYKDEIKKLRDKQ